MKVLKVLKRFVNDEQGLETVEYAIIMGLIVAGTIGVIASIGTWVNAKFVAVEAELNPTTP